MKTPKLSLARRTAALAFSCVASLAAAQTGTTSRAISWGAAASVPAASPSVIRSQMGVQPVPSGAAPKAAPANARIARPDAAVLAKAPPKVIRVPAVHALPPAGAALAAANAQVLADAHATPARSSGLPMPKSRPMVGERIAVTGAADAAAMCIPGSTSAPKGAITPGGRVSMRGCELGSRRGEMRMLGQFPGGMVKLTIEEWTPQLVIASVPAELRGVVDQDVRFQLIPAAGSAMKEQPGRFQARRETVELPDSLFANVNCAHPQPSECTQETVLGARWASAWHSGGDSQRGSDEWRLSVGRAWELERIEHRIGLGLSEPRAQPHGGNQQIVNVDWVSRPDEWGYHAQYLIRFFVTGPAGVPFTAGLN